MAQIATLTRDIGSVSADVSVLAQTVRDMRDSWATTTKTFADALDRITERINTVDASRGPTWTGISQVALLIATYTVIISGAIALYVRGESLQCRLAMIEATTGLEARLADIEQERDREKFWAAAPPDFRTPTKP